MKTIELTHGKVAIVDDEDYPELAGYKWIAVRRHSDPRHEIWAAVRTVNNTTFQMHREIVGLDVGERAEILHINGNRLDNRKANLVVPGHRIVVRSRKFGTGCSRYKGVHRDQWKRGWAACIAIDGKSRFLGVFHSEEDAAVAYDCAARKTYGQLTSVNFPELDVSDPPPRLPSKNETSKTSKYRGVFWHKKLQKWRAAIKRDKRQINLGTFISEADAARAYDAAIIRHGRDKKNLNFPNDVAFHHPNQHGDEIAGKTPATRAIGIS